MPSSVQAEWKFDAKQMDALIEKGKEALANALDKGSKTVEAAAKKKSPVKYGYNRARIVSQVDKEKLTADVHTESKYGGYLEIGTKKMPARPYIYPAYEESKDKIIQFLKEALDD